MWRMPAHQHTVPWVTAEGTSCCLAQAILAAQDEHKKCVMRDKKTELFQMRNI